MQADIVVLVYYCKGTETTIITTRDRVDEMFGRFKRFGIRQLGGGPTCCADCQYTKCWHFGKASRCSEKSE